MKVELKNNHGNSFLKIPYNRVHRDRYTEIPLSNVLEHDSYCGVDIVIHYVLDEETRTVSVESIRTDVGKSRKKQVNLRGYVLGKVYGIFESHHDKVHKAGEELMDEVKSDIRRKKVENMVETSKDVKEKDGDSGGE